MVKIRYFKIRVPDVGGMAGLATLVDKSDFGDRVSVVSISVLEIILRYTTVRQVRTVQYLRDGSEIPEFFTTMEQHAIRIFAVNEQLFLAVLDPPRGDRIVSDLLSELVPQRQFFIEPMHLTRAVIDSHIGSFEFARLVSAKVRDFQIYEKAVARLEVTSKEGLLAGIAPLLDGKYYRVELLTFDVTHKFAKGLISYSANGTMKMSPSLVEFGFPEFEKKLSGLI